MLANGILFAVHGKIKPTATHRQRGGFRETAHIYHQNVNPAEMTSMNFCFQAVQDPLGPPTAKTAPSFGPSAPARDPNKLDQCGWLPMTCSMPPLSEERYVGNFESQVVDLVYQLAKVRYQPVAGVQVPDFFDTLNDAVLEFYRKYKKNPNLFPTAQDAANWVFKVVGNMKRWTTPELALPLDDIEPFLELTPEPQIEEPAEQPGSANSLGAAIVIQQYFADPKARHQGRLTMTEEEVQVVKAIAEYGLSDSSTSISTAAYQLISETLETPIDQIQRILYKSRAAFAEIFYVVGALGPPDAFDSTQQLDLALASFWANFKGQNDWSILKFAARWALPQGRFARVDPKLYAEAIADQYATHNPTSAGLPSANQHRAPAATNQAARLGWQPGGADPPTLLHKVETRAAQAFGNPNPRCVLCNCQQHYPGGDQ
ncbi:MAG: hypothetical protein FWG16_00820 [Micrococcales bacterium]|nr:hypothetical protein [Micrococcales bacterium]